MFARMSDIDRMFGAMNMLRGKMDRIFGDLDRSFGDRAGLEYGRDALPDPSEV